MLGRRLALALCTVAAVTTGLSLHASQAARGAVPAFADFTIQHRYASDGSPWQEIETLYISGASFRREFATEMRGRQVRQSISITNCAARRSVQLHPAAELFTTAGLDDWNAHPGRAVRLGAEVLVTIDGVETGERRNVGPFVARRVRTTIDVRPGPGANTKPSTTEIDGWYISPPGLFCEDAFEQGEMFLESVGPGGLMDRRVYETKGRARRGYPVEETTRVTEPDHDSVNRIQMIRLSEEPLDPALFRIPADYRPALRLPGGGYDVTRPDTFVNRVSAHWSAFTRSVRSIFY
jgi:hypothetical protein